MKHICDFNTDSLPSPDYFKSFPEGECPVSASYKIADEGRKISCGMGTFCRDGITQLSLILDSIVWNKARDSDLELILQLCKNISLASDCAISERVSFLIASSIEYQRERWDDHLIRRRCPDVTCPGFVTYYIIPDKCIGCGKCAPVCTSRAIDGKNDYIHVINESLCTRCGCCKDACPENAIEKTGAAKPLVPDEPVPVGSFSVNPVRRRRRRGE